MRFQVKALDGANQVVPLMLEAHDEAAASDFARQRGYTVVSTSRASRIAVPGFRGRRPFPTTLFSIELLALLEAGLNVVEALQSLAEQEPRAENRQVLGAILEALQRGESISVAMERQPQVFSQLYVATMRSSERTGNVRRSLLRRSWSKRRQSVSRRRCRWSSCRRT